MFAYLQISESRVLEGEKKTMFTCVKKRKKKKKKKTMLSVPTANEHPSYTLELSSNHSCLLILKFQP
jgi:hypothetical protein